MERVALLGGSFNPPHVAHQMLGLWALSTGRADQVWLVPTFAHPFGKQLVAFEHRLRMCELAIDPFDADRVKACPVEAELGAPSRTLNTVRALSERFATHEFSLLVGSDILEQKDAWYRFDEIARLVQIIAVGRAGHASSTGGLVLPPVSSSEVRRLLRAGGDVSALLPAAVLEHIRQHRLYGVAEG